MSQSRMVELISEIDLTGDVEVSQDNLIWWPARYAATCESHKRPYICRRTDVKRGYFVSTPTSVLKIVFMSCSMIKNIVLSR